MREEPGNEGVSKCPESHNEFDLAGIQHGTNWKPVGQFLVSIATGGPKNSFAHFSGKNVFCLQYLVFRQNVLTTKVWLVVNWSRHPSAKA